MTLPRPILETAGTAWPEVEQSTHWQCSLSVHNLLLMPLAASCRCCMYNLTKPGQKPGHCKKEWVYWEFWFLLLHRWGKGEWMYSVIHSRWPTKLVQGHPLHVEPMQCAKSISVGHSHATEILLPYVALSIRFRWAKQSSSNSFWFQIS